MPWGFFNATPLKVLPLGSHQWSWRFRSPWPANHYPLKDSLTRSNDICYGHQLKLLGLDYVYSTFTERANPWSNPYPNSCCLFQVLSRKPASQWSTWVYIAFLHLLSWQTNTPAHQKLQQKHTSKCFTLNISFWILVLNVVIRIITLRISYSKQM